MIDTMLDAVYAAGIEEVVVVRGYLGEQFDQLLYKYPGIRFVENPLYNEANNISSAFCARKLLQSAYVLEADLVLYNQSLITKYQYASNYLGVPVERTDDWCFEVKQGAYHASWDRRTKLLSYVRRVLLVKRGRRQAGRAYQAGL